MTESNNSEGMPSLQLVQGTYASEENLQSSIVFLKNTLTSMGLCSDLNLQSTKNSDVVTTCNTIYALLQQRQQDAKYKEQIKQEVQRARVDVQALSKDRARLEAKLAAKERELGSLSNKSRQGDDANKEELTRAKREVEDLQKKLAGYDRRHVQMQHEIKRKEREYERLRERLSHYLADKKQNEKAILDMAGQLTNQLSSGPGSARNPRTDEGLKAVVAAYEAKQRELSKENSDLRAALSTLQSQHRNTLNAQMAQREAAAAPSGSVMDEAFFKAAPSMSPDELRAELANRLKLVQRRMDALSKQRPGSASSQSVAEQRLQRDLQITKQVIADQEQIILAGFAALRSAQHKAETQHRADMKGLAQRYQGQLASVEEEINKVRNSTATTEEMARMKDEMASLLGEARAQRAAAIQRAEVAEAALKEATASKETLRKNLDAEVAAAVAVVRKRGASEAQATQAALKDGLRKAEQEKQALQEKHEQEKQTLAKQLEKAKRNATDEIASLSAQISILTETAHAEKSQADRLIAERDSALSAAVQTANEQHAEAMAALHIRHQKEMDAARAEIKAMEAKVQEALQVAEARATESETAANYKMQTILADTQKQNAELERSFTEKMVVLELRLKQVQDEADARVADALKQAEQERTDLESAAAGRLRDLQQQLDIAVRHAESENAKVADHAAAEVKALEERLTAVAQDAESRLAAVQEEAARQQEEMAVNHAKHIAELESELSLVKKTLGDREAQRVVNEDEVLAERETFNAERLALQAQLVAVRRELEAQKAEEIEGITARAEADRTALEHKLAALERDMIQQREAEVNAVYTAAQEDRAQLEETIQSLERDLLAQKQARGVIMQEERAAAEDIVKAKVAEALVQARITQEAMEREIAALKREMNKRVGDAKVEAEMEIAACREQTEKEKALSIRQIKDELAIISRQKIELQVQMEDEKKKAVQDAEAQAAAIIRNLERRIADLEESKGNWQREKYQKFSVALKEAEQDKVALENSKKKIEEYEHRIHMQELELQEITDRMADLAHSGGTVGDIAMEQAEIRLQAALKRAALEKQDALQEAEFEKENAVRDLKEKVAILEETNARLLADVESFKSNGGIVRTDSTMQNKLNELMQQLDQERSAKETKDKKLKEALIQAEAARRASMQAIDSQKQFEDMQATYKQLMKEYAPGLGAGNLIERAVTRRTAGLYQQENR